MIGYLRVGTTTLPIVDVQVLRNGVWLTGKGPTSNAENGPVEVLTPAGDLAWTSTHMVEWRGRPGDEAVISYHCKIEEMIVPDGRVRARPSTTG